MKRNQARAVNQTTNDCISQVANDNSLILNTEKPSADLIQFKSSEFFYETAYIAEIAKALLEKHVSNVKQQYQVVDGQAELSTFLNRTNCAAICEDTIFIIYKKTGQHWVTFCITKLKNKVVVLYKDSLGAAILAEIESIIKNCFDDKVMFKSHSKQEQTIANSCAPMCLRNMEIMLQKLSNDKIGFIDHFEHIEFCTQAEIAQITQNFKVLLEKNLSKQLKHYIKDLVKDKDYSDFKEELNKLLDTCWEYSCLTEPMEQYRKALQAETVKIEKDQNYQICEETLDKSRRNFLEHVKLKAITQQPTHSAQDKKQVESADFMPVIQQKFPKPMEKFRKIFDFLAKSELDENFERVLRNISTILDIDYVKMKQFFELKNEVEKQVNAETKAQEHKHVIEPKSLAQITQDIPALESHAQQASSVANEKTLAQLLAELVLDFNVAEPAEVNKIEKLETEAYSRDIYKKSTKAVLKLEANFDKVKTFHRHWQNRTAQDILRWAKEKKAAQLVEAEFYEALAVMDRANELVTGGHKLRDTQILAVLVFLATKADQAKLCQISTGEGKTTIISLLATLKALQGKRVDVITSNQVLAEAAKQDRENFYGLFGISVATNSAVDAYRQGPRACYAADIVYGSIGNFQFDYLRDAFEGLETRAKRAFECVILDEVDSMLVDNGGYIAKLAEPFPGIDYLKYVYIKIWQELYKAEKALIEEFEQNLNDKSAVLYEQQKNGLSTEALQCEYERYKAELLAQQFEQLKNKIKSSKPADIELIPTHLKQYAADMLDKWIDNAIYAKYQCKQYEQYVVKKNNNMDDVIVPVDYENTGVTLRNTIWSNGLHQFVQLKHNLQLTTESLTSAFISNIGYIKLYNNNMLGLTGTLGSVAERALLSTVYNVTYASIPTYKQKHFEELPGIVVRNEQWINCIALRAYFLAYEGRAVLIICKTIKDLQDFEENIKALQKLEGFDKLKIKTYADEDSSHIVEAEIGVSEIIIATNIAGRGTDFKTTLELQQKGGLHVCSSYLPVNQRVEDQAFGRTARQGKAGTAQLIIKESEVLALGIAKFTASLDFKTIKQKRDEIEKLRLEKLKNEELNEIAFQDSIFSKFSNLYRAFKQAQLTKPGGLFVTKDLKEFWACWLQKKSFKHLVPLVENVESEFQSFKQAAASILSGNITHNPYYSILQAEQFSSSNQAVQAKKALQHALALSNEHVDLLYAAHIKLFEVAIETGNQWRERFKKAMKAVIFMPEVETNKAYKIEAKNALELAKQALEKEIHYLNRNFFGEALNMQDPNKMAAVANEKIDFLNILTHNDGNLLLKQIVSRLQVLMYFYEHTNSLLKQINDSIKHVEAHGLAIQTRIPNYIGRFEAKTANETKIKNAINADAVLTELGLVGLETVYALRTVHDVAKHVITGAQLQITTGLTLLSTAALFPPCMVAMGPIAGALISEGICDVVIELISQGDAQFNAKAYIKGKCISYGITLATMGIAAIARSTKMLDRAIKACKWLADTLRKCPILQSVCEKLATQIDKLTVYLEKSKQLIAFRQLSKVEQLSKLEKLKTVGDIEQLKHLGGAAKFAQLQQLKQLGKLEIALPRLQILTRGLAKIGINTLQGVVGSVITEKLVTKALAQLLEHLKPTIKENVQSTIETELTLTDQQLNLVDEALINDILSGTYGEIANDILKEVALGVLRRCNNWKVKIASITADTAISMVQIVSYTAEFCKKLKAQLKKAEKQVSNSKPKERVAIIALITISVTERIYGLICQLAGKHAHTFIVDPIMHKAWNLFEGVDEAKKLTSEEEMIVSSFCEIIDDLETLGLKAGASKDEVEKAYRKMALKVHPQRNRQDPEANAKFQQVNSAYDRLRALHRNEQQRLWREPLLLPSANESQAQQLHQEVVNKVCHQETHGVSDADETLGLKASASKVEVKKSFEKVAIKVYKQYPEANGKSQQVKAAYDRLKEPYQNEPPLRPLLLTSANQSKAQQLHQDIVNDVGLQETRDISVELEAHGLKASASNKKVEKTFRKMAVKLHKQYPEANGKSQQVKEACDILKELYQNEPSLKPLLLTSANESQAQQLHQNIVIDVGLQEAHIGNIQTLSAKTKQCIIVKSQNTGEVIKVFGNTFEDEQPMVVSYLAPKDGKPGHYSMPEEVTKTIIAKNLSLPAKKPAYINNCLYDALLPQYQSKGINISAQELRRLAEEPNQLNLYYAEKANELKLKNPITKKINYEVQAAILLGGRRPLNAEEQYPCHANRIEADKALNVPIAALRNSLNEYKKKAEMFNDLSEAEKLTYIQHNKSMPCFGNISDKDEMMIGALEVKFKNGTVQKLITVSGDVPFCTRLKLTDIGELNYNAEPVNEISDINGYKFVDCGRPKGCVYDLYNRQETKQNYTKSCAAQKGFYYLQDYIKKHPELELESIKMIEGWYKPANKAFFSADQVIPQASCQYCEKVLPSATGANFKT